jgi:hypothetical protein
MEGVFQRRHYYVISSTERIKANANANANTNASIIIMKSVAILYGLKNFDTGETREPTLDQIRKIVRAEVNPILRAYATSGKATVETLGGRKIVLISYLKADEILMNLLLDPDDDGNYEVGNFFWTAKVVNPSFYRTIRPNLLKIHNKSPHKSPRRVVEHKHKSPKKSPGCSMQMTKKYMSRSSPPYPANECCGMYLKGNDGKMYFSGRAGGQRSCTWKPAHSWSRSPKRSPKNSPRR